MRSSEVCGKPAFRRMFVWVSSTWLIRVNWGSVIPWASLESPLLSWFFVVCYYEELWLLWSILKAMSVAGGSTFWSCYPGTYLRFSCDYFCLFLDFSELIPNTDLVFLFELILAILTLPADCLPDENLMPPWIVLCKLRTLKVFLEELGVSSVFFRVFGGF